MIRDWSACFTCRAAYPKVQAKAAELAHTLSLLSKGNEEVDMAYALMCETMDVLGLVGFDKAYHNLDNFGNRQPAKVLDVSVSDLSCMLLLCNSNCMVVASPDAESIMPAPVSLTRM